MCKLLVLIKTNCTYFHKRVQFLIKIKFYKFKIMFYILYSPK
uniref:Uncharacterized protein n=1 Tax=Myoviridae sp. ctPuP5 TaxID=2823543 RepID=A0A8S5L9K6_9CAUD|nr:MAG TPA: hypothetical protein [Myoviridae sp. ctPuP5]